MRSFSRFSLGFRSQRLQPAAGVLVALLFTVSGCGGSTGGDSSKTEAQLAHEAKVQAQLKQGKSISQIRAEVNGEPEPAKKLTKPRR